MTLFSLIDETKVHLAPGQKLIHSQDYQRIVDCDGLVQEAIEGTRSYKKEAVAEIEKAKELAEEEGFQLGLERWASELKGIHEEVARSRQEFEKAILSTAILAAQKFVGRELKLDPGAMIDIVKNSLKAVIQHKRISIYCNPKDYELLDKARPDLKQMFEELEVLGVYVKESVEPNGYIIETERGIINHSSPAKVWNTLQEAFEAALRSQKESSNPSESSKEMA